MLPRRQQQRSTAVSDGLDDIHGIERRFGRPVLVVEGRRSIVMMSKRLWRMERAIENAV